MEKGKYKFGILDLHWPGVNDEKVAQEIEKSEISIELWDLNEEEGEGDDVRWGGVLDEEDEVKRRG